MKLPVSPPALHKVLAQLRAKPNGSARFQTIASAGLGPAPGGKYRHWDTLGQQPPLQEFSAAEGSVPRLVDSQALPL